MNYCPMCKKLVNVNEERNVWLDSFTKFWLIIGSCQECNSFLYQHLEERNER